MKLRYTLRGAAELDKVLTDLAQKSPQGARHVQMRIRDMIYGYARVSTDAQDLTNQRTALKVAGCEKIFCKKTTGAHTERPQLQKRLRKVTEGDVETAVHRSGGVGRGQATLGLLHSK